MPRLTLMHSFLDRFDVQLQVDCERMKREFVARIDQQFGVMRAKVNQLKNLYSHSRSTSSWSLNIEAIFVDHPSVEDISFDEYLERKRAEAVVELQNASGSSSGNRKRKLQTDISASNNSKKAKTQSRGDNAKSLCKFPKCGKSFSHDFKLAEHERIHLNIKPFSCTWPDCKYSSQQRSAIVMHIRLVHFKLPKSVKKQIELNIEDDRNPNEFVRVDQKLVSRRL